MLELRNRLS